MVGNTTIVPRAWAEAVAKPEIGEVRSLKSGAVLKGVRLCVQFEVVAFTVLTRSLWHS
jgi:hypothetical protein